MSNTTNHIEGRFNIIQEIGDGLTARVFKAYDHKLKRNVALKVLNQNQQKFWGKPMEELFENEVKALS
jgi:serine/threonine protein kinase